MKQPRSWKGWAIVVDGEDLYFDGEEHIRYYIYEDKPKEWPEMNLEVDTAIPVTITEVLPVARTRRTLDSVKGSPKEA